MRAGDAAPGSRDSGAESHRIAQHLRSQHLVRADHREIRASLAPCSSGCRPRKYREERDAERNCHKTTTSSATREKATLYRTRPAMACVTVSLASATPAVAPSLRRAAHVRRGGSVVVRGKKAAFFKEFDEQYQKDNEVKEMDENVMKGWPGLASEYPRTRRESCRHATVPSMCRRRIDRPPSVGSRAPPRAARVTVPGSLIYFSPPPGADSPSWPRR